jgi:hypothetical protein
MGRLFLRGTLCGVFGQRRLPGALAHHLQDLGGRVIVEHHVALSGLPPQLLEDRLGALGLGMDNVPLGRGWQGNAHAPLQPRRTVERHPAAIFQQLCCVATYVAMRQFGFGSLAFVGCVPSYWRLFRPAARATAAIHDVKAHSD